MAKGAFEVALVSLESLETSIGSEGKKKLVGGHYHARAGEIGHGASLSSCWPREASTRAPTIPSFRARPNIQEVRVRFDNAQPVLCECVTL